MAEKLYELTHDGLNKLHEELNNRKTVVAAEIAERLKEARALGDLSENSEYDDAKEAQAQNEVRIMEIEGILKNSRVIDDDEISKTKVSIGSQIVLRDEGTGEDMTYILVGTKEEDIFTNRISSESPVGAAIIGKKKGQTVEVHTPVGTLSYKIVKIGKPS
ncbi:MAG: transcription elongation factor GreA [Eubacteriales bacterium]|nr:transcription elongation factor GreA [Eubacteriales bacterium]MDD3503218.1 transcription elongation factor GreA [Eubacteriales bacterium]MDD4682923.1 transcription elongation factor GreA [Eubacteriales bacterium]